jgi:hypothetical protein
MGPENWNPGKLGIWADSLPCMPSPTPQNGRNRLRICGNKKTRFVGGVEKEFLLGHFRDDHKQDYRAFVLI